MINDKNRFDIEYILKENTTIDMDKYKSFSEETKVNISDKVSAKIIGSIRKKINKEYFEYIQKSKGNIKNLKDYQNLKKSISLIQSIFNKNNMSTVDMKKSISIVSETMNILELNSDNFMKCFTDKNEMTILLYNSMVAAIIEGINIIIANFIDVKTNQYNLMEITITDSKKTITSGKIFTSMEKFIDMNNNKKLNKVFKINEALNLNEEFKVFTNVLNKISSVKDSTALKIGTAIFVIVMIPFILRKVVFFICFVKVTLAKKLENVANLLEINASTMNADSKVREKQLKSAEKLKELAKKINIDSDIAEKKSDDEIDKNDKEIKDDVDNTNDDVLI